MKRPKLNKIELEKVSGAVGLILTISPGQWDTRFQAAYDMGAILLEVDHSEKPIAAYRKTKTG